MQPINQRPTASENLDAESEPPAAGLSPTPASSLSVSLERRQDRVLYTSLPGDLIPTPRGNPWY